MLVCICYKPFYSVSPNCIFNCCLSGSFLVREAHSFFTSPVLRSYCILPSQTHRKWHTARTTLKREGSFVSCLNLVITSHNIFLLVPLFCPPLLGSRVYVFCSLHLDYPPLIGRRVGDIREGGGGEQKTSTCCKQARAAVSGHGARGTGTGTGTVVKGLQPRFAAANYLAELKKNNFWCNSEKFIYMT